MEKCFQDFNGVAVFLPRHPILGHELGLKLEATVKGFGIVLGKKWIRRFWPQHWWTLPEACRDLLPVMLLVKRFTIP